MRQPLQHSLRHWKSCHLRPWQPLSHQVSTGHWRTNMTISSSFVKSMDSWFTLQGIPERAGELENPVHLDYILNFLSNQGRWRIRTIGSLLLQMLKHRKRALVHSWITCSEQWTMTFQFAAESTSLKRPVSLPSETTWWAGWLPTNPGRLLQLPDGWWEGTECAVPVGPCPRWQTVGEEATCSTHQGNNSQDVRGMQDSQCHQQQNGIPWD